MLRKHVCHKVVEAARIASVDRDNWLVVDADGMSFSCRAALLRNPEAVAGDYLVRYADDYVSISPRQAFEDGYTELHEPAAFPPARMGQVLSELPGQRVTGEYMESRVVSTRFIRSNLTTTICELMLDNGYSVRGESACVDPANYRQDVGETLARQDAFRKLWPLFGFLLAEARYRR